MRRRWSGSTGTMPRSDTRSRSALAAGGGGLRRGPRVRGPRERGARPALQLRSVAGGTCRSCARRAHVGGAGRPRGSTLRPAARPYGQACPRARSLIAPRASGVVRPASSNARAYTTSEPPGSDSRKACAAGDDGVGDGQRGGGARPGPADAAVGVRTNVCEGWGHGAEWSRVEWAGCRSPSQFKEGHAIEGRAACGQACAVRGVAASKRQAGGAGWRALLRPQSQHCQAHLCFWGVVVRLHCPLCTSL